MVPALAAFPVRACPIPVYQYSLEWWERDPYEIYVFHTGTLTAEQRAIVDRLEASTRRDAGAMPVNLEVRVVQADSERRLEAHSALGGQTPLTLPWMAVHYPSTRSLRRGPIWTGELNPANWDALVDSPVRKRICELLINRTSVVWLLLESGNARADSQAANLLERELDRLQRTLTIPELGSWGMEDIVISDIEFETLRVSRADPAEQVLIAMLLNTETDLARYVDQPMVFPIFGRGLVMEALIGRGINSHMIRKTAEFLTGPCSCTVKARNPGTDLLTNADWAGRVKPLTVRATTQPSGLGGFLESADAAGSR